MKHLAHGPVCALSLALSASAAAQEPARAVTAAPARKYGVEIDVVQPFVPTVGIIKPKLAVNLWGSPTGLRGDLIVGLYLRPHIGHDVVKTIDEYLLVAGYRQYFWRGLHAEVLLDGGVAWGKNRFDGRSYTTPSLFLDANAGYRFAFFEAGGLVERAAPVGFFVAPQVGVIGSLGVADIGPRHGKPDWFLQGNLLVGVSF